MAASEDARYERFTVKMAVEMAAPHTWPAAVLPTLVAASCAAVLTGTLSISMTLILLVIVVLMQSSVNTFNDYYDYVKGTDSADDNVDPTDAVLVYNNVNPHTALAVAVGYLVVPFALGIYVIVQVGWIPLVIALVGALFVGCYSAGKTPISYLPLGEAVSGIVMGGLIPLAAFQALTHAFSWLALLWAVPEIIGVGLIMMTNNTCDIDRDVPADRKTLPVLLGRERARSLYHALIYLWMAAIVVIVGVYFTPGLIIMPFMLLAAWPIVKALLKNPLDQAHRMQAMPQCLSVNVVLGAFYCAGILSGGAFILAI